MKNLFWFLIILFTGLYFDNLNIFRYWIVSSMLHEAGHIAAYRFLLSKWPKIEISVFGFTMINDIVYSDDLKKVLICGPAVNLRLCIISVLFLSLEFRLNCFIFLSVNTIILVFNLLPVYYLDGGQLLYQISPYYQKNYTKLSIAVMILVFVMVIYFTGFRLSLMLFGSYFIINTLNDV